MARPTREDSIYRVSIHRNGIYRYATTHTFTIVDGVRKYRNIHWGTLSGEGNRFVPGAQYYQASPEERRKLIFPEGWDLSEAEKLSGARKAGRPSYDARDRNRLYGAVWLLDHVAERVGLKEDLLRVFAGNEEKVADVLTLAYFPYITGFTYNRVARGQDMERYPSERELTPSRITRFTQSITEADRLELLRCRARRVRKGELCAVDSTTRYAYGNSLADVMVGKSKEGGYDTQTTEVVVYSIANHMPVYYRTFPGNIPDSRSVETLLTDLSHAGFPKVTLVTDRGYESLQNLEKYILRGQAMIMCVSTHQTFIMEKVRAFGKFSGRPEEMEVDEDARTYYRQYDMKYVVQGQGDKVHEAVKLKLNLYFSAERRGREQTSLDIEVKCQRKALQDLLDTKARLDDDNSIKRNYNWFKVGYNPSDRVITSFELDERKVADAMLLTGFFANVTLGVDKTAMQALDDYGLRDEQEKYFQQMKSQMKCSGQRVWSEEGKTGRLFILFVSLIVSSYLRYIWKSTELHKMFTSSLEILDEMRPIRIIEHEGRRPFIVPFVGKQLDVCRVFGFTVPEGCNKKYKSRKVKSKKGPGRPTKPKTTTLES